MSRAATTAVDARSTASAADTTAASIFDSPSFETRSSFFCQHSVPVWTLIIDVRRRFSALGQGTVFFDGPGGTQVPDEVIDAISAYLRESNANLGGAFERSRRSDLLVGEARRAGACFLGCGAEEVVF